MCSLCLFGLEPLPAARSVSPRLPLPNARVRSWQDHWRCPRRGPSLRNSPLASARGCARHGPFAEAARHARTACEQNGRTRDAHAEPIWQPPGNGARSRACDYGAKERGRRACVRAAALLRVRGGHGVNASAGQGWRRSFCAGSTDLAWLASSTVGVSWARAGSSKHVDSVGGNEPREITHASAHTERVLGPWAWARRRWGAFRRSCVTQ